MPLIPISLEAIGHTRRFNVTGEISRIIAEGVVMSLLSAPGYSPPLTV
jgi:hypothetical protein